MNCYFYPKKVSPFTQKYYVAQLFSTLIIIKMLLEQQISISEWFLKDHVTLKTGVREREVVCGQVWWPILGICALHLTHTHSSEHTPGAVGSQCCGARGAVGGSVPCSRVSPQSWYWRWRECWLFTPPTYNPCRTWDSNPRPSGYKSNSLSITGINYILKYITIENSYFK